ncbi:MAG TPA: BPSS1780 family membrane protein, partial [Azonexus sp.]|nr:BPSS1780 family membrane protein [Azonexus sp.]
MSESPQFPIPPAPFKGDSREVDAGACFDWLAQGWAMFLAHPGIWLGASILLLVILMAISIVPLFGQIAAHLLVPLFGAGMLQISRAIADGGEPQIGDLFAGFRSQAGQLVMVGVFFAIGVFGIALIAFLLISGGLLGGAISGRIGGFGIAFGGFMLAGLLVMLLSVPVIMATWFAPALVY